VGAGRDLPRCPPMHGFELSIETMRRRRGIKWHEHGDDVVPAWLADMDFAVAEPVQCAIERLVGEATYLAWLDCRDVRLPDDSPRRFFLERARVALHGGPDFGPGGETCVRLTFATSEEILEELLSRMGAAILGAPASRT
jgi:bifunctional pyridoxal-dependent enzyme with beta-cystathionase and maltose regulon repressor activities